MTQNPNLRSFFLDTPSQKSHINTYPILTSYLNVIVEQALTYSFVAEFTINVQNGHPRPLCTSWHAHEAYFPDRRSAAVVHNIGYPDLQTSSPSSNNSGTFNVAASKQRKCHNNILWYKLWVWNLQQSNAIGRW